MKANDTETKEAVRSYDAHSRTGKVMNSFGPGARFGAVFLSLVLAARVAAADELAADEAGTTDGTNVAAQAAVAVAEAPAAPSAKSGKVDPLTGVTLGSSDARQFAHVLISRRERAEGRSELSLIGAIQVNGKFTQHIGTGLEFGHHLREAFALTVGGTWYPYAALSDFTLDELIRKAKQQPFAASAVVLDGEVHAGFELSPIYGKFAVFNSGVVQFGFFLGSAVGVGHTKIELSSPTQTSSERSFGDIGYRPVGVFNAGFRMFFSERFALRAEIRDTVYSSVVDRINGCTKADLTSIAASKAPGGCPASAFTAGSTDLTVANDLVSEPSSDIINNLQFTTALSVLF
ncbi:MAG: hypothetical protein RL199_981 [Pseudomonadota bacterium]|jgi:outer membrane beta-barrel protein